MSWRPAKAISTLKAQIDAAYPNRPKDSDGIIGDASHSARASDHNPNDAGVVCAIDITDPHGKPFEVRTIAEAIKDDPRVHYVIHERKIYNASVAKYWRPYNGSSPHDEHMHVSLWQSASKYDDARPFDIKPKPAEPRTYKVMACSTANSGKNSNDIDFEAALIALCKKHGKALYECTERADLPDWTGGWYRKG